MGVKRVRLVSCVQLDFRAICTVLRWMGPARVSSLRIWCDLSTWKYTGVGGLRSVVYSYACISYLLIAQIGSGKRTACGMLIANCFRRGSRCVSCPRGQLCLPLREEKNLRDG